MEKKISWTAEGSCGGGDGVCGKTFRVNLGDGTEPLVIACRVGEPFMPGAMTTIGSGACVEARLSDPERVLELVRAAMMYKQEVVE